MFFLRPKRFITDDCPIPKNEISRYCQYLQEHLPDQRDNRGKRHDLAFVLTGLLWALLRSGGHLSLSKLHRWMVREHDWLVTQTGHSSPKPISDPQLRRVLAGLDYTRYNALTAQFFNWSTAASGVWYSVDGKDLRGSIDGVGGHKRGQALVRLVCHEDAQAQMLGFYAGDKDSERSLVSDYIRSQPVGTLKGCRFTLDALHLTPDILGSLQKAGSGYVVGLKANQAELLAQLDRLSAGTALQQQTEIVKGHGRVEERRYSLYRVADWWLDERWQATGLQTLLVVDRRRVRLRDGQTHQEQAYFVSNLTATDSSLCRAIREHWCIEADHHVRDTTGGEDGLKCYRGGWLRSVASALTVGINLLRAYDRKANLRACWEDCTADRQVAVNCWKTVL